MSNKELALEVLEKIPDYKMGYVLSFLRGFQMDDEIEDDLYCERLYQDYLNDPDPEKHTTTTLEALAEELGVKL